MTDLILRDIDPALAERIRKVAQVNGWTMHQTILHLIERGLYATDGGALRFDSRESDVLQSVIAALEGVPNDPGFSLIGRFGEAQAMVETAVGEVEPARFDPNQFDTNELERFIESVPVGSKLGSHE
jgi:hypothetical protein